MLRSTILKPLVHTQRRHFVSTVLLTRNWENESVVNLRKEAKSRGLPQSGNKATLITRLQQFEEKRNFTPPPAPVQQQVRHASTTEVPGVPSSSEPPVLPHNYPKELLDVHIPDTNIPIPELPVQIPFVPDFWDSQLVKAASEKEPPPPSSPHVLAVAGDTELVTGGTPYSQYGEVEPSAEPTVDTTKTTFFEDVAYDLLIPTSLKLPSVNLEKQISDELPQTTSTSAGQQTNYSRTLDKEEVKGVWALVGLLAGSWLLAGLFQAPSAYAEKAIVEEAENSEKH
ncbi:hypothetical protein ABKN59_008532 [Abortiporus biennis]